jgi:hypothetical protein
MEHAATDPMNSDMAAGGGYQNKRASKRELKEKRDKRRESWGKCMGEMER